MGNTEAVDTVPLEDYDVNHATLRRVFNPKPPNTIKKVSYSKTITRRSIIHFTTSVAAGLLFISLFARFPANNKLQDVDCDFDNDISAGRIRSGVLRGRTWYLHANDTISSSVLSTHDYDPGLGKFIRESLSAFTDGIFLDIGANVGVMTSSSLQVGRYVVAVEALTDNARLLQCSANLNGYSHLLTLHNRPLSNPQQVKTKYCVCRPPGNPSDGILVPQQEAPGHAFCSESDCESPLESTTIDHLNIVDPVAVMKIDVEGLECLALSGGHALLKSNLKPCVIVAEFNPGLQNENGCTIHDMTIEMASRDYRPYRFLDSSCATGLLTADELYAMDRPGTVHNICWMPMSPPRHCHK